MTQQTSEGSGASVYNRVRNLVFSGQLAMGERLRETQIAARLGVSRIPVRESLAKLVGQGMLVNGGVNGGVQTRSYTADEVWQLFEYRSVLEGAAAANAAQFGAPEKIYDLLRLCDAAEADIECDIARWAEHEYHFHGTLADCCRNQRVAQSLKVLIEECYHVFYSIPREGKRQENLPREEIMAVHHRPLARAIETRSVELAERLARDSMLRGGEDAVRRVAATGYYAKPRAWSRPCFEI